MPLLQPLRWWFPLLLGSLIASLLLGLPVPTWANMAPPQLAGDLVGEPVGNFQALSIVEEILLFDLRPLDRDDGDQRMNLAQIIADYQIENPGDTIPLKLLFIAPGIVRGSVKLDDQPIPSRTVQQPDLPESWQAPETVPSLDQDSAQNPYLIKILDSQGDYNPDGKPNGMEFSALIPPGRHHIQVSYDLQPGSLDKGIYRDYQIGYVLAPAKFWSTFGQLKLTIETPESWLIATLLPLSRTGNRLTATFSGIPADSIGITTRPTLAFWQVPLSWATGVGGWGVGLFTVWQLGRGMAGLRRRFWRGNHWSLNLSALIVLLAVSSLIFVSTTLTSHFLGMRWFEPQHLSHTWVYPRNLIAILLQIPGLALANAIALVAFRKTQLPTAS